MWFTKKDDTKLTKESTPLPSKKKSEILSNDINKDKKSLNENKIDKFSRENTFRNSKNIERQNTGVSKRVREKPKPAPEPSPSPQPPVEEPIQQLTPKISERNKNTGGRLVSLNKKEPTVQVMPTNPFERIWNTNDLVNEAQKPNEPKSQRLADIEQRERELEHKRKLDRERELELERQREEERQRELHLDLDLDSDIDLGNDFPLKNFSKSTPNRQRIIGGKIDKRSFIVKPA